MTKFALAALCLVLLGSPAALAAQALCNGRDLTGWDGDSRFWRVEEGCLVGETSLEQPASANTFLIYRGAPVPQDFELTLQVRLTPKNDQGFANSGVQIRSLRPNPQTWQVFGLQPDISAIEGQFGFIYDEGGPGREAGFGEKTLIADPAPGTSSATRRTLASLGKREELLARIHHRDAWNHYRIVARGPTLQVFVNGRQTTEMDLQSSAPPLGDILALQLHAGPPMKVAFKDLTLNPPPPAPPPPSPLTGAAPWRNVALASLGGRAAASDSMSPFSAAQAIDGTVGPSVENRWHSQLDQPYPHWLELTFARPESIARLRLHPSDAATFPAKVRIEVPDATGRWTEVATRTCPQPGVAQISFPAVETARLRIVMLEGRGAAGDGARYAQLSEVEALAPRAASAEAPAPSPTPFSLADGDRVVLLGDTLIEREGRHGFLEARLAAAYPQAHLTFRNLGWSGDTPEGISRGWMEGVDDRFAELQRQLAEACPTALVLGYGTAAALEDDFSPDRFCDGMNRVLDAASALWPSLRVLFLAPPPVGPATSPQLRERLAQVTLLLQELAQARGAAFASFGDRPLPSEDGLHWNAEGYRAAADLLAQQLALPNPTPDSPRREALRQLIVEKNARRFFQWRFQNWVYLAGPRRADQGRLTAELAQFEKPIAALELQIQDLLRGGPLRATPNQPSETPPEPLRPLPEIAGEAVDVQLFAETPLIGKPVQISFDERGRLWVVCSSSYPQAKPEALPDDRIYVLEDLDRDGRADHTTLFADRLCIPCGAEPGDGGCYVAASTELLFLQDRDGDGRADHTRVLLSGFGTEDSHHLIHGLRWGPDGGLYFNQSLFIRSHIETPQGMRRAERGQVWRFSPRDGSLATISHGWINPWSKAVDRYGNYFTADNSGEGIHFTFRDSVHFTQTAPRICPPVGPLNEPKLCGLEILRGPAWPDSWQGRVVAGSHTGHAILQYELQDQGAGFSARKLPDLLQSSDNTVRPVDLQLGPDGALYMADWTNAIINHGEVDFRDQRRDLTHGRIWRISAKNQPAAAWKSLANQPTEALCASLMSANPWAQYHARRLLKERGPEVLPAVHAWAAAEGRDEARLEVLWLHAALGVPDAGVAAAACNAADGRVRAAALRAAPSLAAGLRGAVDPHPRVRLEAARVLAAYPTAESAAAVLAMVQPGLDPHLDYALWLSLRELSEPWLGSLLSGQWAPEGREAQLSFGLSAISGAQAGRALAFVLKDRPLPGDGSGPWLMLIGQVGELAAAERLWAQFSAGGFAPSAAPATLQALEACARRGLLLSPPEESVRALFAHALPSARDAALRLAGYWQQASLGQEVLARAAAPGADEAQREAAFASLRLMRGGNARDQLRALGRRPTPFALRQRALMALGAFEPIPTTPDLLQLLRDAQPGEAAALWKQLFSSAAIIAILRDALADAEVPPFVSAEGLRLMDSLHLSDDALRRALGRSAAPSEGEKQWTQGECRELAAAAMDQGDIARGQVLFLRPDLGCTTCHAIAGQEGKLGPDLAKIGASAPLDYIVESVVNPAAAVKEGYNATQVVTSEGLQFFGLVAAESDSELTLRDAAGGETKLPQSTIRSRQLIGSLMPGGLTASLKRGDLLDLIRYLASLGR